MVYASANSAVIVGNDDTDRLFHLIVVIPMTSLHQVGCIPGTYRTHGVASLRCGPSAGRHAATPRRQLALCVRSGESVQKRAVSANSSI